MPFSWTIRFLAVGASLLPIPLQAQSTAADPVLQELIDEALLRNPGLAAAGHTAAAAEARPIQAGSRPGPALGLFYTNDGVGPSLGREPMTVLGLSAGQDVPYPGKLSLRRGVADAEAGLVGLEVERARLSLVAAVKRSYYGLLLARHLAELARGHREVWRQLQEAARARYASAVGSQQEMLRAQVEITRLHALHAQHHAEARARLAELNALLGRTAETPVEAVGELRLEPEARSAGDWLAWSEANSPELKAAALAVERDDRAVSLARLEFKPDFNVQGGVMYRGSLPPMWQVAGSLMLPSRGRAKGVLAEALSRLDASRARLTDVRLRLRAVVDQRLALLQAVQEIEAIYRDGLLPQEQLSVESARARYASSQGPQAGVLDALSTLFDDRTDYLRLLAVHATERARLEEASLEPPQGADSLLMHGRGGRMPDEGSMAAPPGTALRPAAGAGPSQGSRMEMR
jgi:outer membrane protein, heavy metal efflux system